MQCSYNYTLELQINHPDGIYSTGDIVKIYPVVFANTSILASGKVKYRLMKYGTDNIISGEIELGIPGAAIFIEGKESASYLCEVEFKPANSDPVKKTIGFVIEPEKFTPSWGIPADFDAFWARQKQRLAKIPLQVQLVQIKGEDCNAFDLTIPCVDDIPVSGLFITPKDLPSKSCPAIIHLHGAGVHSSVYNSIMPFVSKGYIALDINAHGLPNLMKPEFYNEVAEKKLSDYRVRNFCDELPDNIYFVNMFLRVKRAVEFMVSRPEWDGRNIILAGTSQGGFQSLAGAYLDDRISAVIANIPAGSNILDGGWPFRCGLSSLEGENKYLRKNVPYIDAVCFASRLKIPVALTVGLIDSTCPPIGVFSVYNACKGEKVIFATPETGHTKVPLSWNNCIEFIEDKLKSKDKI